MTDAATTARHWPALAVFLALTFAAATWAAQYQPGDWYAQLTKPAWNPPDAVFAPVWTVLYALIGVAAWLVWQTAQRMNLALVFWAAQLILNAAWSWLFFGLHRPDLALIDIGALLAAIVAFMVTARRRSKWASLLFIPYAAWVAFASALNVAIWRMN